MIARLFRARRRVPLAVLAVLAGACLLALGAARAADGMASSDAEAKPSPEITPAEQLVFTTDHMRGVAPQTELEYALAATGSGAQGREHDAAGGSATGTDVVRVLVHSRGNAKGDAQVSDHSGAVTLPTEGLPCNPVVLKSACASRWPRGRRSWR